MLNAKNERELCYVVKIDDIKPIEGADRVEVAVVNGWRIMVRKGQFQPDDLAIYFEIDSKVPEKEPFMFLADKHFKVKTQKYFKGTVISQGLLMAAEDFGWDLCKNIESLSGELLTYIWTNDGSLHEGDFLTKRLGVTYSVEEDNKRKAKANPNAKYQSMMNRHPKFAKTKFARWCMKYDCMKKILYLFLGSNKKDKEKTWPVGLFPGVSKTNQERCENMTWILQDKSPFIVTQKCDGSSGTFILERKGRNKFEFYVCSRNVRMKDEKQECFYGTHNYYWEVANIYKIEDKMRKYLEENPDITFVCWQGEICAPKIQGNPHNLSKTHLYCFHWTDSKNGRMDIREAKKLWDKYFMETVPIINENYIMPDDFEEFKKSADGFYDSEVCEGHSNCAREGYVYYKIDDPTFSFKNVSREYLLKH